MMEVKGIKCDNKKCNYDNDDVNFKEYPSYINKPCPVCGSNLLTQTDYDNTLKIMKLMNSPFIRFLNKVGNFFGSKPKRYEVKMDGTGTTKIEEVPKEEDAKDNK